MRSLLCVVFSFLFFPLLSAGQTATPELTSSAGGSGVVGVMAIDWSLGEPVVVTMEQPTFILTTGFHQNDRYCPGDFNGDGVVNSSDLSIFVSNIGCVGSCIGDLNFDGVVNVSDLSIFLAVFGTVCD